MNFKMKKIVTLTLVLCMFLGVYAPSASAMETTPSPNTAVEITSSTACDFSEECIPCYSAAENDILRCDLNGDGLVTAADINLLIYVFKNGKYPNTPDDCGENGHSYEDVVTTVPTCVEKGEKTFVCTGCGKTYTEEIPALGHNYQAVVTAPTATKDGYAVYTCACGDTYTEAVVPVSFTVTSSNRADIGYTGTESENLVIPAVFEKDGVWYRVTSVGNWTFYNCTKLTRIVIPDSVTSIGDYAFYNCAKLKSIVIPDSVTSIGKHAFSDCIGITGIALPDSITSIGSSAFYNCTSLAGVTIPNGVTSISDKAFYRCTSLASIIIGDGVESVGESAFYYCSNLTSVTIGSGVTSIGSSAFYECYKLVEVINKSSLFITAGASNHGYVAYYAKEVHNGESKIVNQNSYLFYTYNGVNYLLGYVGNDTELTLPASYNGQSYEIYESAFSYFNSLTGVTIGSGVTSIGKWAFFNCKSLTNVTIGKNVTSIGETVFSGSSNLTSIVFEDASNWYRTTNEYAWQEKRNGTSTSVTDPNMNATYFTSTYSIYYWYKK